MSHKWPRSLIAIACAFTFVYRRIDEAVRSRSPIKRLDMEIIGRANALLATPMESEFPLIFVQVLSCWEAESELTLMSVQVLGCWEAESDLP